MIKISKKNPPLEKFIHHICVIIVLRDSKKNVDVDDHDLMITHVIDNLLWVSTNDANENFQNL